MSLLNEREVKPATLLATLPILGREWQVSFDFRFDQTQQINIAKVWSLTVGGNRQTYGNRNSAVFFSNATGIRIASAVNGNANFKKSFKTETPELGIWTHIAIGQEKIGETYIYRIQIGGREVFSVENIQAEEFRDVKVFASRPNMAAQPGRIRALIVHSN